MEKFRNKYRIASTRLQNWDYGSNAMYFVTICTQGRECYFGNVVDKEMIFSDIGTIAHECWQEIPTHFPYILLGEYKIMPNHVHGIIVIDKPANDEMIGDDGRDGGGRDTDGGRDGRDAINRVSTAKTTPQPLSSDDHSHSGGFAGNKNPMLNDNLSRIIRWYKGRVSFESRNIHADFAWQPRFHDHIIRNGESFQRISDYIRNNPSKWTDDKFYGLG